MCGGAVRESGGNQQVAPVRFCERNGCPELGDIGVAQFECGEAEALNGSVVRVLHEWQTVSAFILKNGSDGLLLLRREAEGDEPFSFGGERRSHWVIMAAYGAASLQRYARRCHRSKMSPKGRSPVVQYSGASGSMNREESCRPDASA